MTVTIECSDNVTIECIPAVYKTSKVLQEQFFQINGKITVTYEQHRGNIGRESLALLQQTLLLLNSAEETHYDSLTVDQCIAVQKLADYLDIACVNQWCSRKLASHIHQQKTPPLAAKNNQWHWLEELDDWIEL